MLCWNVSFTLRVTSLSAGGLHTIRAAAAAATMRELYLLSALTVINL